MKKLTIGVFFAIGCNHSSGEKSADPLTVLAAPQAATNYDYPFWKDQFQRKTDLWQKARNFCEAPEHASFVNCRPVLTIAENASASNWLGKGTPIPFGLVPKPTTGTNTH